MALPSAQPPRNQGNGVKISSERLFEFLNNPVATANAQILAQCMDAHDGVLPIPKRFAGRTFCTPGNRLGLSSKSLFPGVFTTPTGLDEEWSCCTTPINTGLKMKGSGNSPFREGLAHVHTPDGYMVSFEELIQTNPEQSKNAQFSVSS